MVNMDISRAFKRAIVHPDLVSAHVRYFSATDDGEEYDFVAGFMVPPCGLRGSPGYLCLITDAIQDVHRSFGHSQVEINGMYPYEADICAGDAMFCEVRVGARQSESESIRRELLVGEGIWKPQRIMIGCVVEVTDYAIALHRNKIEDARSFAVGDSYCAGPTQVRLDEIQVLRGLRHRRLVSFCFRRSTMQAIDSMLQFGYGNRERPNFPCPEMRSG